MVRIDLKKELRESHAGLVCLAWESRKSVWINYEAGALANAVGFANRRVYPYLLDLEDADVPGPLKQFQSSKSTREGSKLMVRSIAESSKGIPDCGLTDSSASGRSFNPS